MKTSRAFGAASLLIGAILLGGVPSFAADSAPDWEQLARGLDSSKTKERLAAVQAVDALRNERAAAYLQPILAEDKDRDVRLAAAEALGRVPGEDAVTALGAGLADGELKVRKAVVEALRRRPEPSSVPLLAKALQDRKPVLRQAAVLALGTKLSADQASTLVPALADSDSDVRQSAVYALGTTGGETAIAALATVLAGNENKKMKALAADTIGMMGSRSALPELVNALDGADDLILRPSLNNALLRILGRTENRVAEEQLEKRAAPPPRPEPVRERPREPVAPVLVAAAKPAPPAAAAVAVSSAAAGVPPPSKAARRSKPKAVAIEFKLKAEQAKQVFLAGAFLKDWKAMDPSVDGTWSATVYLKPGEYRYQFVVDGKATPDPEGKKTASGFSVATVAPDAPQP